MYLFNSHFMKYNQFIPKLIGLSLFLLVFTPLNANVIESKVFKYKLNIPDSCEVTYEGKDSTCVHIISPNGKSSFYIVGISTDDSNTVFNNDFMEMADSCFFHGLNRKPDETDKPFFLARQDHYYNIDDSLFSHTRILLLNDKAILLGGFCKKGDTSFIDECIENFQSATMLGMTATFFIFFVWMILAFAVYILWEDNKFYSILLAIAIVVAFYYFHFVLDYSFNYLMLSEMG